MKKVAVTLTILSALFVLAGIAIGGTAPQRSGTLTFGRSVDSSVLEPALNTGNPDIWVLGNIMDTLVRTSLDGKKILPGVALSWTPAKDNLAYSFKLRPGVRFSNGTALTPEDIKWSLERASRKDLGFWSFILDTRVSLVCPACATQSHMTPIAAPTHEELTKHRNGHVGIVYRCDACEYPVFLRHPVRAHGAERIELAPQFIEVEHPREKFAFAYLPRHIESLFRAALDCYAAGAYAGFTLLSRQIALAMFADLGPSGRLRVFEELDDITSWRRCLTRFSTGSRICFSARSRSPGPLRSGWRPRNAACCSR